MAATVWILAGVSSTTRMRSFMSAPSDPEGRRRALEQRLGLAEGVAFDVTLEFLEAIVSEQGTEQLPMRLERIGCAGIKFAQTFAHLSDPSLERLRIRRRGRRGRRRSLFAKRGTQTADQRPERVGEASTQGLDRTCVTSAGDLLFERRCGRLDGAGSEIARH